MSAQKRKRCDFTHEEKLKMMAEIKRQTVIWDLNHPHHSNHFALNSAWKKVGENIGKEAKDCKVAFNTLKACRRYHYKEKMKKSGAAGGTPIENPSVSDDVEWEYWKVMKFLPNIQEKRKPITAGFKLKPIATSESSTSTAGTQVSSPICVENIDSNTTEFMFNASDTSTSTKVAEEADSGEVANHSASQTEVAAPSSYFYQGKKRQKKADAGPEDKLLATLSQYVTKEIETEKKLEYQSYYTIIDSQLKAFPGEDAENLLLDFLVQIKEKKQKLN